MDNSRQYLFLRDAVDKCITEDALISSESLDQDENIHYYNGALYYEDGARIGNGVWDSIHTIEQQDWSNDGDWFIVCHLTSKQTEQINLLHQAANYRGGEHFKKKFLEICKLAG